MFRAWSFGNQLSCPDHHCTMIRALAKYASRVYKYEDQRSDQAKIVEDLRDGMRMKEAELKDVRAELEAARHRIATDLQTEAEINELIDKVNTEAAKLEAISSKMLEGTLLENTKLRAKLDAEREEIRLMEAFLESDDEEEDDWDVSQLEEILSNPMGPTSQKASDEAAKEVSIAQEKSISWRETKVDQPEEVVPGEGTAGQDSTGQSALDVDQPEGVVFEVCTIQEESTGHFVLDVDEPEGVASEVCAVGEESIGQKELEVNQPKEVVSEECAAEQESPGQSPFDVDQPEEVVFKVCAVQEDSTGQSVSDVDEAEKVASEVCVVGEEPIGQEASDVDQPKEVVSEECAFEEESTDGKEMEVGQPEGVVLEVCAAQEDPPGQKDVDQPEEIAFEEEFTDHKEMEVDQPEKVVSEECAAQQECSGQKALETDQPKEVASKECATREKPSNQKEIEVDQPEKVVSEECVAQQESTGQQALEVDQPKEVVPKECATKEKSSDQKEMEVDKPRLVPRIDISGMDLSKYTVDWVVNFSNSIRNYEDTVFGRYLDHQTFVDALAYVSFTSTCMRLNLSFGGGEAGSSLRRRKCIPVKKTAKRTAIKKVEKRVTQIRAGLGPFCKHLRILV